MFRPHERRAPARWRGRGPRLSLAAAGSLSTVLAVTVPVLHHVVMWCWHLL